MSDRAPLIERLEGSVCYASTNKEWPNNLLREAAQRIAECERELKLKQDDWLDACQEIDRLRAALDDIKQWAKAYPLESFPEPDFKKAAAVLKDAGMTLDAISASNMRRVIGGVEKIVDRALEED